jgi:mono/diheme cytochrome c family protein
MQRGEAAGAPPALYTPAQAQRGHAVFERHCAVCHGAHLEGRVGPALKGEKFASVKAGFTIQQIFDLLSVEMPAYAPGSLTPKQYVQIMAFLLQQNGYPAGRNALTAQIASGSAVALVYRALRQATPETSTRGAPASHPAKQKPPLSGQLSRAPSSGKRSRSP